MKRNSYNILLIEDDQEDAFLLKRMLEKTDAIRCNVNWAKNAEEVDSLSEKTDFDVIVSDFYLGHETARDIVLNLPKRLKDVAVIILTGAVSSVADEVAFGLGVDYFLSKSNLEASILERTVRYAIRNREQQNRLKNFSRFVAHDLKGLVGHVSGSLQLLREDLKDIGEEQIDLLDLASGECQRILEFINELQQYSLSQDGELHTEETDLNELLEESIAYLAPVIEARGVTIDCGSLPVFPLDPALFKHVFQNLIRNGIKYNRQENPIIKVEGKCINGFCSLSFSDNGIGIDPASAVRIFQPLVRLHGSEEFNGTGMGLAICKEVVTRHGGRIWAESSGVEGKGAHFVIQLPSDPTTKAPFDPVAV